MYNFFGVDGNDSIAKENFRENDDLFKQHYDLFDMHLKVNSLNIGRDTNKLRIKS